MFCLKHFSSSHRAFQHPLILFVFSLSLRYGICFLLSYTKTPFLSTKVILAVTELKISNTNSNKGKTKQHDLVKNKS